ncbi:MFS transporter [Halalkalicoccus jeotgali]|uniref:Major facilitator superfamily MFS_1 n=1 Tax=Halalkalicoccus jeotgali (strain DSM 18796 / CECT 7217 / JCM 14584 / KCTC 4019 / B3) TaxID=795797 RepID=D8J6G6_HALJB|nr:MFS transporter [Halalkalicoccus jeotgali]ADJ13843.1 major facilitator superfamily MFS_1 [Halalkalicoccus jeotgali B3]ELY34111.1 major facilitator superfamily protein [Halalkalicoccus jeotgali B3]
MSALSDPTKRRWLAWGALATVFLLVNLHRLSTAVLSGRLSAGFDLTAAQLGTLHASFFLVYALVQVPTGVLADRVGPRHVGSAGAVLLSAGAVGFALGGSYPMALFSRAIIGLGSGVIFVSILRFCANWFRTDEFGTMAGLTSGVAGLGAILATTPLAVAAATVGWRRTVLALAAVGLLASVAVYALARSSPAAAGLDPIEGVPEQPSVSLAGTGRHLRTLAGDLDQWLLSAVFFAGMGTLLTLIGLWGVPYLVVVYGLDVTTASYFTLLGSVGMFIGPPAIGWFSDRIERRLLPMSVGLALFALALGVIPVFGRPPLPVVAGVYFCCGFLVGAAVLALSVVKERYPPEASGVATATVNTAGFVGATVFPTAMGVVLDAYRTGDVVGGTVVYTEFGYRVAFAIVTGALVVALLCSLWLFVRNPTPS